MTPDERAKVQPRVFLAPVVNAFQPAAGNIASYACLFFVGYDAHDKVKGSAPLTDQWIRVLNQKGVKTLAKTGTVAARAGGKSAFGMRVGELRSNIIKYNGAGGGGTDKTTQAVANILLNDDTAQCVILMVALWEHKATESTFDIENQVRRNFLESYLGVSATNAQETFAKKPASKTSMWGKFHNNLRVDFSKIPSA